MRGNGCVYARLLVPLIHVLDPPIADYRHVYLHLLQNLGGHAFEVGGVLILCDVTSEVRIFVVVTLVFITMLALDFRLVTVGVAVFVVVLPSTSNS